MTMALAIIPLLAAAKEAPMSARPDSPTELASGYGRRLTFSPDGHTLAAVDRSALFLFRDFALQHEERSAAVLAGACFASDGKRLFASPEIYDIAAGRWQSAPPLPVLAGLPPDADAERSFEVQAAATSPDGELLVVGVGYRPPRGRTAAVRYTGPTRRLLLLRAASREIVGALADNPGSGEWRAVAIGERAIAATGGAIGIWDRKSLAKLAELTQHRGAIRDLAFSPDGKWLASASSGADRLVVLWDTATWKAVRSFEAHKEGVLALAFHPRQPLLASAGGDGAVKLWSLVDGKLARTFAGKGPIEGIAWSQAGDRLTVAEGGAHRLLVYPFK